MSAPEHGVETPQRYLVCGIPIAATSPELVVRYLGASEWGTFRSLHFCNTFTLSLVHSNPRLRAALESSSLNLPDGWPIALVGRVLKVPGDAGQVPGPDIFEAALADAEVSQRRHFLFGSSPEVLEVLHRQIRARHPDANIVGSLSPPYGGLEAVLTASSVAPVLEARPDIVWVGLGTPLQDEVLGACRSKIPATVVAVGAAFDFLAETKARAPKAVRRARMEWFWRFLQEPRRLWRRYLIGSLRFLAGLVRQPPRRTADRVV